MGYTDGQASDKKHRYQPQVVSKYVKVVNLMKQQEYDMLMAERNESFMKKLKCIRRIAAVL